MSNETDREATCGVCGVGIVWDPDDPTGQQPRWRHLDQAASYRPGAHRATPVPVHEENEVQF